MRIETIRYLITFIGCVTVCWAFIGLVCEWVPDREFLCLLWCETHTKGLSTRFPARPEVDEGRMVPQNT